MNKIFDAVKFYTDYRIAWTNEGPKSTKGWVQTICPFCKSSGYHLGFHVNSGAYHCWKCGNKGQIEVIRKFLGCDFAEAKSIQEDNINSSRVVKANGHRKIKTHRLTCSLPTGTGPLTERHKAYLRGRGFDAEHLEEVWGLLGTGNVGDYKFRIIAPIRLDGIVVSYQGRDITGKAELRWKACKQKDEVIEHQTILYGLDYIPQGGKCVLVEGAGDCWRLGKGAVSCFGTSFLLAQINLLADRVSVCYIMFDCDDDNASKMAEQVACLLSARGVEVELIDISDTPPECLVDPEKGIDPGNLQQWYSDKIMEELGFL